MLLSATECSGCHKERPGLVLHAASQDLAGGTGRCLQGAHLLADVLQCSHPMRAGHTAILAAGSTPVACAEDTPACMDGARARCVFQLSVSACLPRGLSWPLSQPRGVRWCAASTPRHAVALGSTHLSRARAMKFSEALVASTWIRTASLPRLADSGPMLEQRAALQAHS